MTSMNSYLVRGAMAGAVGITALNGVSFLDMVLRGRPASSTPEQVVRRGADLIGAQLPTDPGKKAAVETGLGSVLGMLAGLSVGVTLGALRGSGRLRGPATTVGSAWVLVMLAGNAPMTVLGVTDPRTWSAVDWAADIVPHTAYALAAAATLQAFDG